MIRLPKIVWIPILAASLAVSLSIPVAAQNAQIRHIAVVHSGDTLEIQIETSQRLLPMTQIITDPDRLVIDFPDAVPGPQLHTVAVNQGEIKSVRASLLSANPAMTRVVIDLKSAQDFQLVPTGKSVTVKFANGAVAKAAPPVPATPAPEVAAAPKPPPVTVAKEPVAAAPKITVEHAPATTKPALSAAAVVTTADQPAASTPSPVSAAPPAAHVNPSATTQIRRVTVLKSGGATEIEIETSQRVVPTTQLIAGPDRLVLDFAGSLPGPLLRALAVNQGEVKGVRAALLTSNPPVTRVVLDLKSPQEFQVFPSSKSVVVKLPGSVSAAAPAAPASGTPAPAAEEPPAPPEPPKNVKISFEDGLLSVTSVKGSLAEVLNEIRAQIGAEIAVPAGAEQEVVAASLGPGAPKEILAQLLNGSRYNFIIVGSDSDANKVDRVILTPKGIADPPSTMGSSGTEPTPVAALTNSARGNPSVRASAPPPPPPTAVPPTDDSQPQGDSIPPDTTPQPGDPQPAPN